GLWRTGIKGSRDRPVRPLDGRFPLQAFAEEFFFCFRRSRTTAANKIRVDWTLVKVRYELRNAFRNTWSSTDLYWQIVIDMRRLVDDRLRLEFPVRLRFYVRSGVPEATAQTDNETIGKGEGPPCRMRITIRCQACISEAAIRDCISDVAQPQDDLARRSRARSRP